MKLEFEDKMKLNCKLSQYDLENYFIFKKKHDGILSFKAYVKFTIASSVLLYVPYCFFDYDEIHLISTIKLHLLFISVSPLYALMYTWRDKVICKARARRLFNQEYNNIEFTYELKTTSLHMISKNKNERINFKDIKDIVKTEDNIFILKNSDDVYIFPLNKDSEKFILKLCKDANIVLKYMKII